MRKKRKVGIVHVGRIAEHHLQRKLINWFRLGSKPAALL
jgi:hypothetical protein